MADPARDDRGDRDDRDDVDGEDAARAGTPGEPAPEDTGVTGDDVASDGMAPLITNTGDPEGDATEAPSG